MARYLIEVTDQDLASDHTFGRAYPEQSLAVVREQSDPELTGKIILHQYGRLKGLECCTDPECVMHRCDTVRELKKVKNYCNKCKKRFGEM